MLIPHLAYLKAMATHMGIGAILSTPQCEMPDFDRLRRASLGEQPNAYHLATALHPFQLGKITDAMKSFGSRARTDTLSQLHTREESAPM